MAKPICEPEHIDASAQVDVTGKLGGTAKNHFGAIGQAAKKSRHRANRNLRNAKTAGAKRGDYCSLLTGLRFTSQVASATMQAEAEAAHKAMRDVVATAKLIKPHVVALIAAPR